MNIITAHRFTRVKRHRHTISSDSSTTKEDELLSTQVNSQHIQNDTTISKVSHHIKMSHIKKVDSYEQLVRNIQHYEKWPTPPFRLGATINII